MDRFIKLTDVNGGVFYALKSLLKAFGDKNGCRWVHFEGYDRVEVKDYIYDILKQLGGSDE